MGWLPVSLLGFFLALLGIKKLDNVQRRLASYGSGATIEPGNRGYFARIAYNLAGLPLGALAVFMWLLAVPNTLRNVFFYGLTDGGSYDTAWGGPTLVGAWTVHALGALALVPIYMALYVALGWLQAKLAQRLLGRGSQLYPVGIAAVASVGGAAFFVEFLRQL